jgi:ribonuclease Z
MLGIRATLGSDKKGDPLVYCDLLGGKRAIMFDLGNNRLNVAQLRRVTDIFVSHTHMDHFIGFDKFLRVNLVEDHLFNIFLLIFFL